MTTAAIRSKKIVVALVATAALVAGAGAAPTVMQGATHRPANVHSHKHPGESEVAGSVVTKKYP